MYLPHRWLKNRGASVLAALVLVAILGAALIILQYVRSSGDFAYESASLTAATAAPASSTQVPALVGGQTEVMNGVSKTTYPCGQTEANPAGAGGAQESIEQCLPGCEYTITPGTPAKISAKNPTARSDPSQKSCTVDVCSSGGSSCSRISNTSVGDPLSSSATVLTAIGITNAPDTSVASQIGSTYYSNSTDSQQLTSDLNYLQSGQGLNGTAEPLSSSQQTNVDAALQALGTPNPEAGGPLPGAESGSGVTSLQDQIQLNKDLAAVNQGTVDPFDSNNPGVGQANMPIPPSLPCGMGEGYNNPCPTNAPIDPFSNPTAPSPCTPSSVGSSNCPGTGSTFPTIGNDQTGPSTCPQGQSGSPCAPVTSAPPVVPPTVTPGGQAISNGLNGLFSNGGLISGATSFLTGFLQGVSRSMQNQQLAQAMQASQAAAAPYGVGSDGNSCPPPQPQPSPSACTIGTWQQLYQSNQCSASWQCVPNPNAPQNPTSTQTPAATRPTATLSCQPQIADVGMMVSMSYSCANATGSAGSGFVTGNQLSGSTTTVISVSPAGANTASYGLTCINQSPNQSLTQSLTAGAQCSILINQPSIVLVANPSVVASSTATAIGWVTTGMKACTISSPNSASFTAANAGNTSVNGTATTSPLTASLTVVLNCQTLGGGTRSASTVVTIASAGSGTGGGGTAPITVSSNIDGSILVHGDPVSITWSSTNPPAGSSMSLWLVNIQTQRAQAVIAGGLAPSGTYTWHTPALGAACNPNASNVCDTDLVNGTTYAIEAILYTPSNAYIGDGTEPVNPVAPTYGASAVGGTFVVDDSGGHGGE